MNYIIKTISSNLIEENVSNSVKIKNYYYEFKVTDSLANLEFIVFKNYYSAFISIMLKIDTGWKYILNDFKVMEYADSEEDAEKIISIHISKLNINSIDLLKVEKFRIYLIQPNTHIFFKFSISNVQLYNKSIYDALNSQKENLKNVDIKKKYLGGDKFLIEKDIVLDLNNESIISTIVNLSKSKKVEENFKIIY